MALNILDWVLLIAQLCLIIPIYFLIKYYRKTKILDYLLLVGFFSLQITNALHYQLGELDLIVGYNPFSNEYLFTTFLLDSFANVFLLLHALRLKWEKFSWYITGIVLLDICVGLLTASRAFLSLPDMWDIFIFLWQLAGWNMFLTFLIIIYAYSTTKPLIMYKDIIIAKRLWIIFGCMTLITGSMIILWPPLIWEFWEFNRFMYLLGTIFIVYIAIRYPEVVLISHTQISRALNLYSSVISLQTEKEIQNFGMSSLVAYIKQIPVGLIDRLADT